MIQEFEPVTKGILALVKEWEPRFAALPENLITLPRNGQGRTIKQIVGHLIDSASNNTHRIVHLQYQASPLIFPNYATQGNNDRWIAIQDYQHENWNTMIGLWKFLNLHFVHVINRIDPSKLDQQWQSGDEGLISLMEMVVSYLSHLELHLGEIEALVESE